MIYTGIEYVLVVTALAGSGLAAYYDIRTTEIPDKIPLFMAVTALGLKGFHSLLTGELGFILDSMSVGGLFLLFGFLMYYTGQWGGGDAKLLAAIGALLPTAPIGFVGYLEFPFFLTFLINLFLVGSIFIILYALLYSFLNRGIAKEFIKDIKGNKKELMGFITVVLIVLFGFSLITQGLVNPYMYFFAFMGIGLFLLFKFLKVIENKGFKRKIKTKDLQEGDMIGEDIKKLNIKSKIIRGLTKKEVKRIRKARKTVWIKEGVRFGPVFPITLVVTLFIGDLLFQIIKFIW